MLEMAKYIKLSNNKKEYVKFLRFFLTQKFPNMNTYYIDEA
jgi:hypothetical protein